MLNGEGGIGHLGEVFLLVPVQVQAQSIKLGYEINCTLWCLDAEAQAQSIDL